MPASLDCDERGAAVSVFATYADLCGVARMHSNREYLEAQRRELESRLALDLLDDSERMKLERALVGVLARLAQLAPR
jgi:hypothetical protein